MVARVSRYCYVGLGNGQSIPFLLLRQTIKKLGSRDEGSWVAGHLVSAEVPGQSS